MKKKVLIIDDDNRNVFALSAVLRARGYQYATAITPHEGLNILSNDPAGIGIILMDMMMPEMDGYTLMPLIQKDYGRTIPIIAVTAQAMAGDKEKCLASGADDYLSKPIDVDKLDIILKEYLK